MGFSLLLLLSPYARFSDVVSVWALRLLSTNRWGWRVLRQEYFRHCDFRRTPSPLRFPSRSMLEKSGQHSTDLRRKNVFLFSRTPPQVTQGFSRTSIADLSAKFPFLSVEAISAKSSTYPAGIWPLLKYQGLCQPR